MRLTPSNTISYYSKIDSRFGAASFYLPLLRSYIDNFAREKEEKKREKTLPLEWKNCSFVALIAASIFWTLSQVGVG